MAPAVAETVDITAKPKNKKIIFNEDGDILPEKKVKKKSSKKSKNSNNLEAEVPELNEADVDGDVSSKHEEEHEEDYFEKREKARLQKTKCDGNDEVHKKWFNVYPKFPSSDEVLDMKDTEQMELFNICKSSFEAEMSTISKNNPSDARWLQTALHKGTAKDRANAGALLVTSNPLGNLTALETLIGYTKLSNKSCSEVINILTDLWIEVLLPPHRKLIAIHMRGGDWKIVRKDTTVTKEAQRKIYAYWHFENELKDQYFEFLKNLQQGIQTGQENNKNSAIVTASRLLSFAPEKEQLLLTMLINKLGDPSAKIASKALHHLSEVAYKHPNMCGVITVEAEKLIFRNNISERAQHFALCFLSSIAPSGRPEVCTKLVHICFSLFKVLVKKGAVNNRTMQAILRCLQKAILEAKPPSGSTEIMNKEMQDTIYRLVHLADIRISVQTLSLLLQLVTVKTEKSDRFYNALYKKMMDIEVTAVGTKTAAQLLHIIHRAIHIDHNVNRAQAFIKRLLQISLYMPAQISAGCLIVIQKLLHTRNELTRSQRQENVNGISDADAAIIPTVTADDEEMAKFDSDGEEKYEDIHISDKEDEEDVKPSLQDSVEDKTKPFSGSSWHHAKNQFSVLNEGEDQKKTREISASKYDPYNRVPSYAGAEFSFKNELILLREHFHPSVRVFADNVLNNKRIEYYGDPLRDFNLPHFLERFAFKNPKKLHKDKAETLALPSKRYVSFGTRGKPVKSLTKSTCTEDEMFIFNYLEQKRDRSVVTKSSADGEEDDDDIVPKIGDVDDDEFEEYLDGFFGKKNKAVDDGEDDLDFLKDLGGELKNKNKLNKKKTKNESEDAPQMEDIDADWGDDEQEIAGSEVSNNDDENGSIDLDGVEDDDDENGSIDLDSGKDDDNDDENESDAGSISFDEGGSGTDDDLSEPHSEEDDEIGPPKSKKHRAQADQLGEKNFAKTLKHSHDMRSLFAAADDFAELLEETGKTKGQGTSNAVFNKDKSSDKQMKWEENRRSNSVNYSRNGSSRKFGKKRKS